MFNLRFVVGFNVLLTKTTTPSTSICFAKIPNRREHSFKFVTQIAFALHFAPVLRLSTLLGVLLGVFVAAWEAMVGVK